jgi:phage repressor protein C with HTH and peptisase S24 domain
MDREFVEAELWEFYRNEDFLWHWDEELGDALIRPVSSRIREAFARLARVFDHEPSGLNWTIPVVGHVSAGEGFAYTDGGFGAGEGFDHVDVPPGVDSAVAKNLYCVRVRGDSLREFFGDGALLFIKPESWEEIRDGDLVIFKDRKDKKAFVKKVEFSGENLILKSMNSMYKNMVVHKQEVILLERVMAIVL